MGRQVNRRGKAPPHRIDGKAAHFVVVPVPAIVGEQEWQACQDRFAVNKRLLGGRSERTYLLSGLARCPMCDCGLTGKREHKTRRPLYRCKRDQTCSHRPAPYFAADELEEWTIRALADACGDPEWLRAAVAAAEAEASEARASLPGPDLQALRAELVELDAREQSAARAQVEAMVAGRSAEAYEVVLSEVDARRRHVSAVVQAAEGSDSGKAHAPLTLDEVRTTVDVARSLVTFLRNPDLTVAERRVGLQGFVAAVRPVGRRGVELTLRHPIGGRCQRYKNTHLFLTVSGELSVVVGEPVLVHAK